VIACVSGGPFLASFPHFYMGDPELLTRQEGLKPSAEKHKFFIDIHDVRNTKIYLMLYL